MTGNDSNRGDSSLSPLRVNGSTSRLVRATAKSESARDSISQSWRTTKHYVTARRVRSVQQQLNDRDRRIIDVLGTVHLATGRQLQHLIYGEGRSAARVAHRDLQKLSDLTVLDRLERRPGGVRGGSLGYVYALDILGQAIIGVPSRRRHPRLPGMAFVTHAVAVTDCYVALKRLEAEKRLEILAFETEPDCWRSFAGPGGFIRLLKPDAFVVTASGDWEDRWLIEVDRASESRARLRTKIDAHIAYFTSGREQAETGVFPKIVWVVPDVHRQTVIIDVLGSLPADYWQLFAVCTDDAFGDLMLQGAGDVEGGEGGSQ